MATTHGRRGVEWRGKGREEQGRREKKNFLFSLWGKEILSAIKVMGERRKRLGKKRGGEER